MADQIQSDLAIWLMRESQDQPRLKLAGLVSVTEVQLNRDFSQAKIFFSVLNEATAADVTEFLNQRAPYMRSVLARQITLYKVPTLVFQYDRTESEAARINTLLKSVLP